MKEPPQTETSDIQPFRDVFNASPIGIAVENLEGQPLFVNPAFCSFLGFNGEELCRKHCVDFSPPEDAQKDWALFQKLKAGLIDHYQLEKRYFRRDGSLVWGRLNISLMNSHPSPLVLAMVEDITEKKRAEEALHESEERLRLAVQAGKMFAYSWDAATDVIQHSGESAEILPIDKDRPLTGAAMCAMAHPDDSGRVEAALRALSVQTPTLQISYRIIRPGGTVSWVEQQIRASFDNDGKLNRMVGMIADVTDRKRAEETRFRLAAIVESSEDAILSKTLDGVIVSWNKGAHRIYEYTEAEAVGKPVFILIPPDLMDEEKNIFERLRAGEHIEHYETIRVTKTGKRINVSLGICPIKDSSGNIIRFSSIGRDITERKRAEDALRSSEERFRLAAQAGRMYSFDWDVTTDVVLRSSEHAEILGLTEPLRITHTQFVEKMYPDDRAALIAAIAGLNPEKPTAEITFRMQHSDGAFVWLKSSGRAFFSAESKLLRVIGMVADITDLKQAEEAVSAMTRKLVEAQEQERARIGRELHDDINQRLAMLAVELEQLSSDPSEFQNRVQGFREELRQISDDVQALSHDLHSTKLEYLGFVAGMKSWCKEFAERQKLDINFRSDVRSVLPVDVGRPLFRVLQEALQNGFKYSGVKRIDVQLREDSGEIHLIVSDTGRGFDVEAALQGKGLGLISMRERVRLVNGTILIESEPMGGTTIHARVPLEPEQPQRAVG